MGRPRRSQKNARTELRADGYWRIPEEGPEYRQCEAHVPDEADSACTRLCLRAVSKGDRLCPTHANKRKWVNRLDCYIITINKKGVVPKIGAHGMRVYPKFVIGKAFITRESAELWASLNGTLIWKIPDIKSYCIERMRY